MYLPTAHLEPVFGLDSSPNQTPITKIGTGAFYLADRAGDGTYTDMITDGNCGYLVTLDQPLNIRNFTYEWSGKPSGSNWGNFILSQLDFTNVNNQLGLSVNASRIVLYYSSSSSIWPLGEWTIPAALRGGDYKITFIREFPKYKVYFGTELVIDVLATAPIARNQVLLLATIVAGDPNRPRWTYRGTLKYARFHDGIVLPPDFWYNVDRTEIPRDVALSNLPNLDKVSIKDTRAKTLVNVQVVGEHMLFKFSDSTIVAAYRPMGTDVGVSVSSAKLLGTDELEITLTSGEVMNLGKHYGEDAGSQWPVNLGGGYLINSDSGQRHVPIIASGNVQLIESADQTIMTLPEANPLALTYDRYIEMCSPIYSGRSGYGPNVPGVYVWGEYAVELSGKGVEYDVSAEGRLILPAGKYYVIGHLLATGSLMSLGRLVDKATHTALLYTNVGYFARNGNNNTQFMAAMTLDKLTFNGTIDIYNDVEVALELTSSSAWDAIPPFNIASSISGAGLSSMLKIYKVG